MEKFSESPRWERVLGEFFVGTGTFTFRIWLDSSDLALGEGGPGIVDSGKLAQRAKSRGAP